MVKSEPEHTPVASGKDKGDWTSSALIKKVNLTVWIVGNLPIYALYVSRQIQLTQASLVSFDIRRLSTWAQMCKKAEHAFCKKSVMLKETWNEHKPYVLCMFLDILMTFPNFLGGMLDLFVFYYECFASLLGHFISCSGHLRIYYIIVAILHCFLLFCVLFRVLFMETSLVCLCLLG